MTVSKGASHARSLGVALVALLAFAILYISAPSAAFAEEVNTTSPVLAAPETTEGSAAPEQPGVPADAGEPSAPAGAETEAAQPPAEELAVGPGSEGEPAIGLGPDESVVTGADEAVDSEGEAQPTGGLQAEENPTGTASPKVEQAPAASDMEALDAESLPSEAPDDAVSSDPAPQGVLEDSSTEPAGNRTCYVPGEACEDGCADDCESAEHEADKHDEVVLHEAGVQSASEPEPVELPMEAIDDKDAVFSAMADAVQLVNWNRYAGKTALGTMSQIVNAGWTSSDTVVLATIDGYWDVLSASALAGVNDAPVLLTEKANLSTEAKSLITKLGASKAYICGGEGSVSKTVFNQVKSALVGARAVTRLAGGNAEGTSIAIAKEVGKDASDTCIIATDSGYWDALSSSSYAYAQHAPIFLVRDGKSLSSAASSVLKQGGFKRAIVAGGSGSVSNDVMLQLRNLGLQAQRIAGGNAYETSDKIASWAIGEDALSAERMGVATAGGYWDALTGAALCGKNKAVLLLGDDNGHYEACRIARSYRYDMGRAYVFGGTNAVGSTTFADLKASTLEDPVTTYWVAYAANGGSGSMADQTVSVGRPVTLKGCSFLRAGYTFTGWNTSASGNGAAYAARSTVTSLASAGNTATLYAQWKKIPIQPSTHVGGSTPSSAPSSSSGGNSSGSSASSGPLGWGDTVYVTPSGKKYHRYGCPTLSRSRTVLEMTKSEAAGTGRDACLVCTP